MRLEGSLLHFLMLVANRSYGTEWVTLSLEIFCCVMASLLSVYATPQFAHLSLVTRKKDIILLCALVYLNRNCCWYNKCSNSTSIKLSEILPIYSMYLLYLRSYHILELYNVLFTTFVIRINSSIAIYHTYLLIHLTKLIHLMKYSLPLPRPHQTKNIYTR